MANDFAALVAELEPLTKALPAADDDSGKDGDKDKIKAAAADGAAEGGDSGLAEDEGEDDPTFGKSFAVTLEDGTKADVFDGTAMVKALHAEIGGMQADHDAIFKALGLTVDANKTLRATVEEQGELIKSLRADVAKLSTGGTGRRSMLTVHDRPSTTVPGRPAEMPREAVMAKALSLQTDGTLDGLGVSRIESHLNRTGQLPPDLAHLFA